MRKVLVILGVIFALGIPAAAGAQQASQRGAPFLITGGGQVVADTTNQSGPGDTIAFVALQTGEADMDTGVAPARGELQVVNTSEADEGSQPGLIFHGNVTCIVPNDDPMDGGTARFGGFERNGEMRGFVVDVTDTGDENRGTDMIEFRFTDEANPCDDMGQGTILNGTTLARGNVKVDTASSGRGGQ